VGFPVHGASKSDETLLTIHRIEKLDTGNKQILLDSDAIALQVMGLAFASNDVHPGYRQLLDSKIQQLLDLAVLKDGKTTLWGVGREWDAFSDGTINAANTAYSYTSILVAYSLIFAYKAFNEQAYLDLAIHTLTSVKSRMSLRTREKFVGILYDNSKNDFSSKYLVTNVNALYLGADSLVRKLGLAVLTDSERSAIVKSIREAALDRRKKPTNLWSYRFNDKKRLNDFVHQNLTNMGLLQSTSDPIYQLAKESLRSIVPADRLDSQVLTLDGLLIDDLQIGLPVLLFVLSLNGFCLSAENVSRSVYNRFNIRFSFVGEERIDRLNLSPSALRTASWYFAGISAFENMCSKGNA
jgi:hypothetical protein